MNTPILFQADGLRVMTTQALPESIIEMIQQQVSRITQEHSYILNCQVSAIIPAFCQAGIYQIQLVFTLPDRDLIIDRDPIPDRFQEDMYVAIWSAFDLARKKLNALPSQANYKIATTLIHKSLHQSVPALRRCVGYARG